MKNETARKNCERFNDIGKSWAQDGSVHASFVISGLSEILLREDVTMDGASNLEQEYMNTTWNNTHP
jgi:hypothetical protein